MMKLLNNFPFGQSIRGDLDLKHGFENEKPMTTEYGDRVEEIRKEDDGQMLRPKNVAGINDVIT